MRAQDSKSVEDFVTVPPTLSKHCEYGGVQVGFVRDRMVVELRITNSGQDCNLMLTSLFKKHLSLSDRSKVYVSSKLS